MVRPTLDGTPKVGWYALLWMVRPTLDGTPYVGWLRTVGMGLSGPGPLGSCGLLVLDCPVPDLNYVGLRPPCVILGWAPEGAQPKITLNVGLLPPFAPAAQFPGPGPPWGPGPSVSQETLLKKRDPEKTTLWAPEKRVFQHHVWKNGPGKIGIGIDIIGIEIRIGDAYNFWNWSGQMGQGQMGRPNGPGPNGPAKWARAKWAGQMGRPNGRAKRARAKAPAKWARAKWVKAKWAGAACCFSIVAV